MNPILPLSAVLLALAIQLPMASQALKPHFSAVTSPQNIAGERRTTAVVDLKGAKRSNVSVYVSYATSAQGVEARPGTYGDARCRSYGAGRLFCTMIFPHAAFSKPNPRDVRPKTIKPGSQVYFRWRKDVRGVGGSSQPVTISGQRRDFVMPRRLTVANIGDSYGSGEGAPQRNFDIRKPDRSLWANEACHRSTKGGQRRGIADFRKAHKGIDVHYTDVGCSGSQIFPGLLQGFKGQRAQVPAINAWLERYGYDQLDALTLSIGGNDLGFGTVIKDCLVGSLFGCHNDPGVQEYITEGLEELRLQYAELNKRIRRPVSQGGLNPRRVLITDYPDPTRDKNGNYCEPEALGKFYPCFTAENLMVKDEAQFAFTNVLGPLNGAIAAAAKKHGWVLLGGHPARTRKKGLCNCESGYYNTISQSTIRQGDVFGAVHMFRSGQDAVYRRSVRNGLHRQLSSTKLRGLSGARVSRIRRAPSVRQLMTITRGGDPSEGDEAEEQPTMGEADDFYQDALSAPAAEGVGEEALEEAEVAPRGSVKIDVSKDPVLRRFQTKREQRDAKLDTLRAGLRAKANQEKARRKAKRKVTRRDADEAPASAEELEAELEALDPDEDS